MNPKFLRFTLFIIALFPLLLAANPVSDASNRMRERLPQIDALKLSGELGETATGFLAIRTELGPRQTALVEAENADRRTVYAAVAERTGQTPEEVGQQRALRIAELAAPGVWLQRLNGTWFQVSP